MPPRAGDDLVYVRGLDPVETIPPTTHPAQFADRFTVVEVSAAGLRVRRADGSELSVAGSDAVDFRHAEDFVEATIAGTENVSTYGRPGGDVTGPISPGALLLVTAIEGNYARAYDLTGESYVLARDLTIDPGLVAVARTQTREWAARAREAKEAARAREADVAAARARAAAGAGERQAPEPAPPMDPASVDVFSKLLLRAAPFGCWVEKELGARDPSWNCGTVEDALWLDLCLGGYEPDPGGPAIPAGVVRRIHPRLERVTLVWRAQRLERATFCFDATLGKDELKRVLRVPPDDARAAGGVTIGIEAKEERCLEVSVWFPRPGTVECDGLRRVRPRTAMNHFRLGLRLYQENGGDSVSPSPEALAQAAAELETARDMGYPDRYLVTAALADTYASIGDPKARAKEAAARNELKKLDRERALLEEAMESIDESAWVSPLRAFLREYPRNGVAQYSLGRALLAEATRMEARSERSALQAEAARAYRAAATLLDAKQAQTYGSDVVANLRALGQAAAAMDAVARFRAMDVTIPDAEKAPGADAER
jgi:hypothetical protein